MVVLNIDRSSQVPAYLQVCNGIVDLVARGALCPGDRLPPSRTLATSVGLHRSTIVRAYEELHAKGYIESRPGSYSTIRKRERPPSKEGPGGASSNRAFPTSPFDWGAAAPSPVGLPAAAPVAVGGSLVDPEVVDLDQLSADPSLAPDADLRRYFRRVLTNGRGSVLAYPDSAGGRPLREAIAARMSVHGVSLQADEILITAGAQCALDLILRFLTAPGDSVVTEAPTYEMFHSLLRLNRVHAVEVPMLKDGMDLDALEVVLQRSPKPKFIYTMPNFQNPTGITTSQEHRERLLVISEKHGVPLVEDGFVEEMGYRGPSRLPVKSMDVNGIVLYVGTFSKVAFPGLRIGWIAAPAEATTGLTEILRVSSIAGSSVAQAAMAGFCTGGPFEVYLRRVHRVYRRRMRALMRGLESHMPPGVSWTEPTGGYVAWLTLERGAENEGTIVSEIERSGVSVGRGSRFFCDPPDKTHLRLSIACEDVDRIELGCSRLGRALSELLQ